LRGPVRQKPMSTLSSQDKSKAFQRWWQTRFPVQNFDKAVVPFLTIDLQTDVKRGWLRAARQGTFKSTGQVAEAAGISRAAYSKFERKELEGKVTIETLERLAEALDCEFVYVIRPKKRRRFSEVIWAQLYAAAENHGWIRHAQAHQKGAAIAKIAKDKQTNTEFRRQMNWSVRKGPSL
jgi:transcriptional regulator with XRE-family HTH domain